MKTTKILSMLGLVSLMAVNSGCTTLGVALGAGAKTGIEAAKEGGISRAVTDFTIQTQINNLWFQQDVDIFRKLDLTVNQGRVLITGVVQNSQHRVDAVRLAWQPKGVKQVINEIRVAESEGLPGYARDVWITTQLRTKLTLDKDVQSINYSIDTVQGGVYLMGVAQNQNELNKVIDQARTISGVKEVVSYVKFAGQPLTQDTLNAPSQPQYDQYSIGQPVESTISPQAGGGDVPPPLMSPYSKSPEGLSPMSRPEPYVTNKNLPPPGQWAGNGGQQVAPVQQSSTYSGGLRESVQAYPLND